MKIPSVDRVRLAVPFGVLALVLASIAWGLHAHWTLALPAAGLLRFGSWLLRGIISSVPILAIGTLIVHQFLSRAALLPPVVAVALRWAVGCIAVTAVGIFLLATGVYSPFVWQVSAPVIWVGVLIWLVATRWELPLAGWEAFQRGCAAPLALFSWEALLILVGALSALGASLPPDTRDELAYHLVLPRLWVFQGDWWLPTSNVHLLFPGNMEILWGWAIATGGLLTPRFVTLLFSGLTIALLWEWLDGQPGGRWARNLALVFLLAAPVALTSMSICYVEWPLMFFLFLGWRLSRLGGVLGERGSIWSTAVVWGMTLGMKYTAFLFTGLLALEWFIGLWRTKRRQVVMAMMAFLTAACLLAAPWFVRNLVASGDPFVPLGASIGLGSNTPEGLSGLTGYVHLQGLWRWIPTVYHATVDPIVDHRLHPGWPLLLLLVILFGRRRQNDLPWATVTISAGVLLLFSPAPRVELPLLLLAALFIPVFLASFARTKTGRTLATAIVVVTAGVSIPVSGYFLLVEGGTVIPRYLLGMIGSQAYLDERGAETPAMEWIRQRTPNTARIWVWCDDRVFYFDRWVRPDTPFGPPVFLSHVENGGETAMTKAAEDIDFIAIRRDQCSEDWSSARVEERSWEISKPHQEVLEAWIGEHLRPVFQGPVFTIYATSSGQARGSEIQP